MKTIQALAFSLLPALLTTAQIPDTLLHSIPAPPVGVQSGAQLGYSVAIEGGYTVVGMPFDDHGTADCGAVNVFDSGTGTLLFVLEKPNPAEGDDFGISVAISGTRVVVGAYRDGANDAGGAYVYDLSSGTPTVPVFALTTPTEGLNAFFGWSVAISGTRVVVGAYADAGSAYVYDLANGTPTVPITTLVNPGAANDQFGRSVAISGSRVVVGAWLDDTGNIDAGSVYVYDLNSGTPTVPVNTLNNPSPATNDRFGVAVAILGTRVVVGTVNDDTGATDAGRAYVYDLASGTPTVPVTTLNNPGAVANDNFGCSLALSGTRLVVGARQDGNGLGTGPGKAYVYDLSNGTPTVPVHTLNNPGPAVGDAFGGSVAISGTQVVVGALSDDTGALDAGSAYIYELSSGTPTVALHTLNHPSPSVNDQFGYSVAVSGTRVVVGAWLDDTGGVNVGSVYVFDLSSATPTVPVFTLNNPSPATSDQFGNSVAISGSRVVVGASFDDTGAANAGSAYVYDLSSGTPTVPVVTLNKPGPVSNDNFGNSVAISGTRVVIGSPGEDTGESAAGSAYVYDLTSGTPTVPVNTLNNPSPAFNDRFGEAVAVSGTRVVVGVKNDDTGGTDAGSVYVYDLSSGTPTVPVNTLNNPGPAPVALDNFGISVAISGARVVVGANLDDTGASAAGSAYVYDLTSGTPTVPVAILNNPTPVADDYFGYAVAISGTQVVVGALSDDTGALDAGSAYIYELSSGTPAQPVATLNNPNSATGDQFARSVAIDGTTVVIGAHLDELPLLNKGATYIYGPAPVDTDTDNDGLLDSWELTYWPTIVGHSALDDFDHDGYVELLELAFGLNPTLPSPGGLPPVTNEGGYLTMTIAKQTGVTYEVQTAGTLQPGLPNSFSPATTTVITNNGTTLKVRDNVLIGAATARFIRVRVTAAP